MRKLAPLLLLLASGAAFATDAPPVLDWRSYKWPTLDYERRAISGGAGLYVLRDFGIGRFSLSLHLPSGSLAFPEAEYTISAAAASLLLEGGIGDRTYEALVRTLEQEAISLSVELEDLSLHVSANAMTEDFDKTLAIVGDLLFKPRFDVKALDHWKQRKKNAMDGFFDASSSAEQQNFIRNELSRMLLGEAHFFSRFFDRFSRSLIDSVSYESAKMRAREFIERQGLEVFASGDLSDMQLKKIEKLISRIPRSSTHVLRWLPSRPLDSNQDKARVSVINKPDLSQANAVVWILFPRLGRLNPIEQVWMRFIQEVFCTQSGGISGSRFLEALRGDSGLSYSPSASFNSKYLDPNTSVGLWMLSFQSPNMKFPETLDLAWRTWKHFVDNGITEEELERVRTKTIHTHLAMETTVFSRMGMIATNVLEGYIPAVSPWSTSLEYFSSPVTAVELNSFMKHAFQAPRSAGVGIFGNLDEDTLSRLKDLNWLNIERVTSFEALVKELKK